MPEVIYLKHFREGDDRIFTGTEYHAHDMRQRSCKVAMMSSLQPANSTRKSPVECNWLEHALRHTGLDRHFLRFALDSKLENFTISSDSFTLISNIIKGKEGKAFYPLKEIVRGKEKTPSRLSGEIGEEIQFLDLVEESLRMLGDFDRGVLEKEMIQPFPARIPISGKSILIKNWQ